MSNDAMAIDSPPQANGDAMDTSADGPKRLPVTVSKPIPYTFDLGNMTCYDSNPLPASTEIAEADITAAARDCAQALINQLLSTCPIVRSEDSVTLTLPAPDTPLPREKPIPTEKPMTKWQEFAKKKGIVNKAAKDSNLKYNEETGEWERKWGYKGKNKEGENDWIVEVDDEKEKKTGEAGDVRKERREERKERVRRQERRERANERRGGEKKK